MQFKRFNNFAVFIKYIISAEVFQERLTVSLIGDIIYVIMSTSGGKHNDG